MTKRRREEASFSDSSETRQPKMRKTREELQLQNQHLREQIALFQNQYAQLYTYSENVYSQNQTLQAENQALQEYNLTLRELREDMTLEFCLEEFYTNRNSATVPRVPNSFAASLASTSNGRGLL